VVSAIHLARFLPLRWILLALVHQAQKKQRSMDSPPDLRVQPSDGQQAMRFAIAWFDVRPPVSVSPIQLRSGPKPSAMIASTSVVRSAQISIYAVP
jgi:hypothetical protein